MTRHLFIFALLIACAALAFGDEPKTVVSEIDLSDAPAGIVRGKPTDPKVISSADELAKVFVDEKVAARIKKAVDFEKQKLVYFAWSGSGQDKLTHSVEKGEKGEVVKFRYAPGRTRDLRGHHKLFALPKDVMFEVVSGR